MVTDGPGLMRRVRAGLYPSLVMRETGFAFVQEGIHAFFLIGAGKE
jgi:hypothetical protein